MGGRTRTFLGWLLGLVLAGVLFYAAIWKGLDPSLFADQITAHKITPASWSPFLAYFFVGVELLIGAALLLRLWPRWTHLAFIALMLGFIGVTAIAWAHGNTKECGCFGRAVGSGPAEVIVRDIVLVVVSLIAMRFLGPARNLRLGTIAGIILIPLIVFFTAFGKLLPADALVTGATEGADLSDLPVEALHPPHTEGTVLLMLIEDGCTQCAEATPELGKIAQSLRDQMRVAAVYSGTSKDAMTWRMRHVPAFPVVHASPRALRAYYRSLPVCFLLKNGRLVHAFWRTIPTAAELQMILGDHR